jgi:prepilin signal peptidase PulO-like enzyme (type II secretory pathway)
MSCGEAVAIYDNVPIVSYVLLRGRCRYCGTGYSARYMLVELLGLGLSVACYYHAARYGTGPMSVRLASFLVEFLFVGGMIAIAFIDIRTMIIPSVITYPLVILLAGAAIGLGRLVWFDSLAGASAGFLFVFGVAEAYRLLRGHEGLGLGDGKLLAVIGGFLGWQALPLVLFLGSLQGLIVTVPILLLGKSLVGKHEYRGLTDGSDEEDPESASGAEEDPIDDDAGELTKKSDVPIQTVSSNGDESATVSSENVEPGPGMSRKDSQSAETVPGLEDLRSDAVPFGPFLALAGVETLFFGKEIISRVSAFFDQLAVLM